MVSTDESTRLLDTTAQQYNTSTLHIDVEPTVSQQLYATHKPTSTGTTPTHTTVSNAEWYSLLRLSLPVTVSYALEVFPLFITTAFIGRLDSEIAMSVNSLSNIVFSLVCMSVMYGCTSALDSFATTSFGARDYVQLRKWLYIAIVCTCACCSVLAVPVWFYLREILTFAGQQADIVDLTVPYVRVLLLSLLPLIVFDCMKRWLQSQHKLTPVLSTTIVCNAASVVLNYLLLYTDWWTITGVSKDEIVLNGAVAVCITNTMMCILICSIAALMQRRDRQLLHDMTLQGRQWSTAENIDPQVTLDKFSLLAYCMQYMQLAVPSIMQSMTEFVTFDTLGLFAGVLPHPERNLAAHAILFQTSVCTLILYYGITTSTSIRVGNAIGEGDAHKAKRIAKMGLKLGVLVAAVMGAVLYVCRNYIGYIYTNKKDVVELVSGTVVFLSIYQIFDCTSNINHGIFRAASLQKFSALFTIIGFGVVGIPAAYVSGVHYGAGLPGIWCSVCVGMGLISFMSVLVFRRIDWHDVVEQKDNINEQWVEADKAVDQTYN